MTFWIAFIAALTCALCNGIAAVLQKAGADEQHHATSLEASLLIRLIRDWRYSLGIVLDLLSGVLILVAVHTLPLFLVQSMIAASILVTFVIERFLLHRGAPRRVYLGIVMVLGGLVLLATTAAPEQAEPISGTLRWIIVAAIIPLAAWGTLYSRSKRPSSVAGLAALGGTAFGGTAIVGRVMVLPHPFWEILENPLVYAFIIYGVLGILLFTIGLQRTSATAFTTMTITTQTLVPAMVGIAFFGDNVRHGLWLVVIIGVALTLVGATIVSTVRQKHVQT